MESNLITWKAHQCAMMVLVAYLGHSRYKHTANIQRYYYDTRHAT